MRKLFSAVKEKVSVVKKKVKGAALTAMAMLAIAATAIGGGTEAHAATTPGVDFSGQTTGIDVMAAISSAFSFLGMFDAWVYLVLGVLLAPVLIGLIFWLVGKLRSRRATA